MQEFVITNRSELLELIRSAITPFFIPKEQPEPPKPPVLLSRKEVAAILKITLPTLQKHTDSGLLKAHYVGRRVLYDQNVLSKNLDNISKVIIRHKRA